MRGIVADNLDGVQLLLAAFVIFFLWLVYHLRREDKREGYPLRDISPRGTAIDGFPDVPETQLLPLLEGGESTFPHRYAPSRVRARRLLRFPGAPLVPIGDPMLAEAGPGAYPLRKDEPMIIDGEGRLSLVPLRDAPEWRVGRRDPDPRGLPVHDPRHTLVGHVVDLWADQGVKILRYLEIERLADYGGGRVLLPIYFADIHTRLKWVRIKSVLAHHMRHVPQTRAPDRITAREEDRVNAYYASGYLFSRRGYSGLPEAAADLPETLP